jgi:cation diffusion facilitator family transporter
VNEGSRRAVVAALLANLGIAAAKFVAFGLTGATALLAEAIHSVADSGNEALLGIGGVRAQRAPTSQHPFGFGRERYFFAFVVALVLFSLGSLFAIYQGADKLVHPSTVEDPTVGFAVLGVAAILESLSIRTAARAAREARRDRSWWRFIRTEKSPELPVVILEDFAALVGLALAALGLGLTVLTGSSVYDASASVAIGLLLGVVALLLAVEMKSLLIGEAASPEDQAAITAAILNSPDVSHLIHLRTEHLGPEDLLVAAKIDLAPQADERTARAIDGIEARIRSRVPHARVIYLEPDEYRGGPDPY